MEAKKALKDNQSFICILLLLIATFIVTAVAGLLVMNIRLHLQLDQMKVEMKAMRKEIESTIAGRA